jgi:inhibitor of KinA
MAMTAVYPLESPGGWHLLGRTPVPLWDLRREIPTLLMPGDKVKFDPIEVAEYNSLLARAQAGTLRLEPEQAPWQE